ncbi:Zonadhesin [Drechslerella dactyloides]|uniref:Zonadhesin n=1 Tax=Drechslerella dactyloides TaxID=74499 RepID=A0AAD6J4B7_DREDA|nr:Zonadhesin [Drechslerella dactyloides]
MASNDVDYYEVLCISPAATRDEIRKAYKVQALKTHPDRVPANHPDRPARTRQFQLVNDAYYTLSDPVRKRDYDATRPAPRTSRTRAQEGAGWADPGPGPGASGRPSGGQWHDEQFGDFFEEMMAEEGLNNEVREGTGKFWAIIGAISGALLGYIIYNTTGFVLGLVMGNRLGAIRDRKGKSVYEVFQEMPQADKMRNRQGGQSRRTNPRNQQFDHDVFEGLPIRRWDKKWLWFAKKNTPPPPPPELPLPKDTHLLTPMSQTLLKAARNGTLGQPQPDDVRTTTRLFLTNKWTVIPREDEPSEPEYLGRPPDTYSQHSRLVRKTVNGKVLIVEEEIEDVYIEPAVANGAAAIVDANQSNKKRPPPPRRKAGRGRKPGFKKMVTFSEDGRALPTGEARATPSAVAQSSIPEGEGEDDVEMGDAEDGTPDDNENSNDGEGSAEPEKEPEVAPTPQPEKAAVPEVVAEPAKREATVEPMAIVSPTPAPASPAAPAVASPVAAPVVAPVVSPVAAPAAVPVAVAAASPVVSPVPPVAEPLDDAMEGVKVKSPSPPVPEISMEQPEAPVETLAEAPVEVPVEAPMEAPPTEAPMAEAPMEEAPVEAPVEAPAEPTPPPATEAAIAKAPTPIPSPPAPAAEVITPPLKSPSPVAAPVAAPVEAPAEAPPAAVEPEKAPTPPAVNPLKRKSPSDEDVGELQEPGLDQHEVSIALAIAERESHDETLTPLAVATSSTE